MIFFGLLLYFSKFVFQNKSFRHLGLTDVDDALIKNWMMMLIPPSLETIPIPYLDSI